MSTSGAPEPGEFDEDAEGPTEGGDEGVIGGWGDLSLPAPIQAFISNPQNFIIGAVATTILETVTGVVTTIVSQLVFLVGGSQPAQFNAPSETIGLADLPVAVADLLIGAGGFSGGALLAGIEGFNATIADAAAALGPFGPFVLIVLVTVELFVAVLILRRLAFVVADFLQLGGLTE